VSFCSSRSLLRALTLVLCGSIWVACDKEYTVEIRPDGAAYERTFTGRDTSQRWAAFYGDPTPLGKKHRYSGRFIGATPAELGGQGSLAYFESPLGSASIYLERFGEPTQAIPRVIAIANEVEQLTTDLDVWINQAAPARDAENLRAFVREAIAPDLLELALRVQMQQGGRSSSIEDRAAELGAYLIERDYLTLEGVPDLFSNATPLAAIQALMDRRLRRTVARRPVSDRAQLPRLPEWESDSAVLQSIARALPATPGFSEWAAAQDPPINPQTLAELPSDELDDAVAKWIQSRYPVLVLLASQATALFDAGPYVTVHLNLSSEPVSTNGAWNAAERRVEWETLSTKRSGALVYSSWAVPDTELQTRRLGQVVLEGDSLLTHVTQFAALSATDQAAWIACVDSLEPGPALTERIRAFRFPSEEALADSANSAESRSRASRSGAEFTAGLLRAIESANEVSAPAAKPASKTPR